MPLKKSPVSAATAEKTLEEQIRERAYQIYQVRGADDGHDLDDWLTAETELTATKASRTAA